MQHLHFQPVDLNEQISRITQFYHAQALSRDVEITEYLESDLPMVMLDPEYFHGALLNLAINAVQAMPEGGQLTFRTYNVVNGVAVDIIDTGDGMDHEVQKKIFDRFYSTKRDGSGLGLPTTRRIIEAHNGKLSFESSPGHGTRFTIELPTPPQISQ